MTVVSVLIGVVAIGVICAAVIGMKRDGKPRGFCIIIGVLAIVLWTAFLITPMMLRY